MMILEASWEVCNKMGGIYTVLSSRAREMMASHEGQVIFVGPELGHTPQDFIPEVPELLRPYAEAISQDSPLPLRIGQWDVPGRPCAVLVDFSSLWAERSELYFRMWQSYGLESDKGYGDYDECSLFAIAAARVMHCIIDSLGIKTRDCISIYNEWQTAMGLLYSKALRPELSTLFITHATTVGRSIAGNGKELYAHMPHYYGDQMAAELGVEAKHAVEKRAAHVSDLFATVSELTAKECTQLIERTPIVLPNGFEGDFVPSGRAYTSARKLARERLAAIAEGLTGLKVSTKDVFISLGGRYEYRNKGIDLYVESIAELRRSYQGKKRIFAFVLVPAWVAEPRADLAHLLSEGIKQGQALQHPSLSHWLHNMDSDATQSHLRHLGLDQVDERVNIIQMPVYLDGRDGIANMSYYDLLVGMDLSVYPSYYEPWGYTPLESIAFGVPTITTGYAGFGLWAEGEQKRLKIKEAQPVYILDRNDHNSTEVVAHIAELISDYCEGKLGSTKELREQAQKLAERAEWKHFYKHYQKAYKQLKPKTRARK